MLRNPQVEMIAALEETLRRLKALYDQFFAGSRPLPPTEDHKRFDKRVRELGTIRVRDNAARFRLNNVIHKYTLYREMWNRQIREREDGPRRYQQRVAAFTGSPEPAAGEDPKSTRNAGEGNSPTTRPVTSDSPDPYVRLRDSGDGQGIQALHEKISAARRQAGSKELSLAQVSAMIDKQMDSLRSKYEMDAVDFRVEVVSGKVKLKAKPIHD